MSWHNYKIDKHDGGLYFYLQVGHVGVPGSVRVEKLTREQAEGIGEAISEIIKRSEYDALENVRRALGIKS